MFLDGLSFVERAFADGWRYLRLLPNQIRSLTPREFAILMRMENEAMADKYERMASLAIMNRAAYHAKKLKHSDLFDRKKSDKPSKSLDEKKETLQRQQEWLNGLSGTKKAEGVEK